MYANINRVFESVRRIYNKQQHGFLSVADFNRLSDISQKDVFDDLLSVYRMMLNNNRRFLANWKGNYNSLEQLQDDLKTLIRSRVTLTSNTADNIFQFPDDYAYSLSMTYSNAEIALVPQDEISYILNSNLSSPSVINPIALKNHNSIEVFPTSITSDVLLTYYKIPRGSDSSGNPSTQSPTLSTITVSGKEIYNPSTSINFELPETTENKIVVKMLQYLGINMREEMVESFAQNEEVKEDQETL